MTAYSEAVKARCREPRRAGGWPDGEAHVGTGSAGSLDAGAWTRLQQITYNAFPSMHTCPSITCTSHTRNGMVQGGPLGRPVGM